MDTISRKNFLKMSALGFGALIVPNSLFAYEGNKNFAHKVRVGLIGVGMRGQNHIDVLGRRDDVEIVAFADPQQRMLKDAQAVLAKNGRPAAKEFSEGDYDFRNLLKMNNLDAVIISTPWKWHKIQGIEAMKAKKIVGMEVSGAIKLQDCWDYVKAYEETKVPIFMMENVCY